jgi:hypothetical protein
VVSGTVITNVAYAGAGNCRQSWYLSGGTLHPYNNFTLGTNACKPLDTSFSGSGALNGMSVSAGLGAALKTVGGSVDMNHNDPLAVAPVGTLNHYLLPSTGGFVDFGGYGQWTTFSGESLNGLTLQTSNGAAAGTHAGTSYRYPGTTGDLVCVDVNLAPVPEAATYVQLRAGLAL